MKIKLEKNLMRAEMKNIFFMDRDQKSLARPPLFIKAILPCDGVSWGFIIWQPEFPFARINFHGSIPSLKNLKIIVKPELMNTYE